MHLGPDNQSFHSIDKLFTVLIYNNVAKFEIFKMPNTPILILLVTALLPASAEIHSNHASHDINVTTYAEGLEKPWGMTFLPDGRLLVTEKAGNLRIVNQDGTVSASIAGMLPVNATGQGGLLDVVLDPDFSNNAMLYFSFAMVESGDQSRTAVGKAKLTKDGLADVQQIWQQAHSRKAGYHYGSRLVFDRTGYLFVTLGDRNYGKDEVQSLSTHFGKVVRIDTDGKPAKDNPFINTDGALPDIYSYGHRNIQGAFLHPNSGELWGNEHGPKGGDEINLIQAGKNYRFQQLLISPCHFHKSEKQIHK